MSEHDFAVMAMALGASCLVAALAGRRLANDERDLRFLSGIGAALAGAALLLLSPASLQ
jgi:hypothetical protein